MFFKDTTLIHCYHRAFQICLWPRIFLIKTLLHESGTDSIVAMNEKLLQVATVIAVEVATWSPRQQDRLECCREFCRSLRNFWAWWKDSLLSKLVDRPHDDGLPTWRLLWFWHRHHGYGIAKDLATMERVGHAELLSARPIWQGDLHYAECSAAVIASCTWTSWRCVDAVQGNQSNDVRIFTIDQCMLTMNERRSHCLSCHCYCNTVKAVWPLKLF